MDCPFCHLEHEHTRMIRETKHVAVILSNPHLMKGHVLVIPKRHVEKPWELSPIERQDLFDVVLDTQRRIIETFATGCDIREHYRPFLPQGRTKIDHIHFHLHPREFQDPLYADSQIGENKLWQDLTDEEATTWLNILK